MGIRDNPTPSKPPCEHKFGCWEYHDQGWWFASLIEVIQECTEWAPCHDSVMRV